MDPERKPGRLFLEVQRGRNCTPLDEDGAADCFVMMRINESDAKRSSTVRALEPLWNEQFQLDCTRADTLHVEIYDDVSMRHVKSTKFAELLGSGSVRVGALKVNESATRVVKLTGGAAPGATLTLTLLWKAQESAIQATHEASLKLSLAQMRHELAISRAQKSSWENSSGYLRSFGVLAPALARNGDLTGPASAEVFADARPPPGQPRREGPIPLADMHVRSSVAHAVAKLYGKHDFSVITQSPSTGSIDVIVGPERKAKHYADFQAQWKARARARAPRPSPRRRRDPPGAHTRPLIPRARTRSLVARRRWTTRLLPKKWPPTGTPSRRTARRCRASLAGTSDARRASSDARPPLTPMGRRWDARGRGCGVSKARSPPSCRVLPALGSGRHAGHRGSRPPPPRSARRPSWRADRPAKYPQAPLVIDIRAECFHRQTSRHESRGSGNASRPLTESGVRAPPLSARKLPAGLARVTAGSRSCGPGLRRGDSSAQSRSTTASRRSRSSSRKRACAAIASIASISTSSSRHLRMKSLLASMVPASSSATCSIAPE